MATSPPYATSQRSESAELSLPGVSSEHWKWVRQLLADVNRQDRHENLMAVWGQWQLVTRRFRQVEFDLMRQHDPQAAALRLHEKRLMDLISLGHRVLLAISETGKAEDFRNLGFNPEAAEAQLALLRQNWEEWHGTVNPQRLEALQARLTSLNAASSAQ